MRAEWLVIYHEQIVAMHLTEAEAIADRKERNKTYQTNEYQVTTLRKYEFERGIL